MSWWVICWLVATICLLICVVAQWVYIQMLEQRIQAVATEIRWTCGGCDNTEYLYRALR
jgi:hypothetical protein